MGWTFIAERHANATASGTSLAQAGGTLNIQAGDLIVGACSWEFGTGGAIALGDGGSNVLTLQAEQNQAGEAFSSVGYKLAASANATATFTFTNSTSRDFRAMGVMQFRPDASETQSLDPAAGNPATAGGSGTSAVSGAITTTGTDTVVFGFASNRADNGTTAEQIGGSAATATDILTYASMWYRILTATMSSGTATATVVSAAWICTILGIQSAAAALGSLPPRRDPMAHLLVR